MIPVLIDTNLVICAASATDTVVRKFLLQDVIAFVSEVSRIEALGYWNITASEEAAIRRTLDTLVLLTIDGAVAEEAIRVRQRQRLSLGDAIIAATALVHDLTLATRNVRDFRSVPGLKLIDPYAAP
jgi:toxin FitB